MNPKIKAVLRKYPFTRKSPKHFIKWYLLEYCHPITSALAGKAIPIKEIESLNFDSLLRAYRRIRVDEKKKV